MTTEILHRGTRILTLEGQDEVLAQCKPGDIAIVRDAAGWWTVFVGDDGETERYDIPFDSYDKALWSAKAAAEFAGE